MFTLLSVRCVCPSSVAFDEEVDGVVLVGEGGPVVGGERALPGRGNVPLAFEGSLDRDRIVGAGVVVHLVQLEGQEDHDHANDAVERPGDRARGE